MLIPLSLTRVLTPQSCSIWAWQLPHLSAPSSGHIASRPLLSRTFRPLGRKQGRCLPTSRVRGCVSLGSPAPLLHLPGWSYQAANFAEPSRSQMASSSLANNRETLEAVAT